VNDWAAAPGEVVCKCGGPRHPQHPQRCVRGHAFKANGLAVTDGRQIDPAVPLPEAGRDACVAAILDALGGADVLNPVGVDQVVAYRRLRWLYECSWQRVQRLLARGQVFTAKGHLRAAVSLMLQLDQRLADRAKALGLRRLPKPVDPMADVQRAIDVANKGVGV
jgi:hypothetical protein